MRVDEKWRKDSEAVDDDSEIVWEYLGEDDEAEDETLRNSYEQSLHRRGWK